MWLLITFYPSLNDTKLMESTSSDQIIWSVNEFPTMRPIVHQMPPVATQPPVTSTPMTNEDPMYIQLPITSDYKTYTWVVNL